MLKPLRGLAAVASAAAALAFLALAGLCVAVLLRDPSGTLVEDQQLPTSAESGPLRDEALAAATGVFDRIEQARRPGDPARLDGVFVPGSPAEARFGTAPASPSGEPVSGHPANPRVLKLTRTWASVQLDQQGPGGTVPYRVALRRVGDRWLVRDLVRLPG